MITLSSACRAAAGFRMALRLAAAVLAALPVISHTAAAQEATVKATHGAWQVKCGKPPGKKQEACALVQDVTAEDRPNVGLKVMFLKTGDGNKQLLRVVAPLGVLLPAGLGLKIDDKDIGQVPFIRCGKIGCVTEIVVKDKLITALKGGKSAIFVIFDTPEAGIGIPISLKGFTAGLASVK